MNHRGFRCIDCGREHDLSEVVYTCPSCGGNVDAVYDYAAIKGSFGKKDLESCRDYTVWRYLPFLPLRDRSLVPPLRIGWTPLYRAGALGHRGLYIKDDSVFPSCSFKDRASSVALTKARETGAGIVCGASTGNAGSSMACLSASVGVPCVIFVPEKAPQAKIAQLQIFGARVLAVKGTYDDAFDLCLKVSDHYGWFNRNTGYNPYTREGKKTSSYEICEQLGWEAPDSVLVPVGDGNIISGLWKGFRDLYETGFIEKLPRMIAVQSERSNSVYKTLERMKGAVGEKINIEPVQATTIADSISVDVPRDGVAACRAVIESKGYAVEVSDEEILSSIKELAGRMGIFAEPAGATSFAGFKKLMSRGRLPEDEKIVTLVTGSGLKDISSVIRYTGSPVSIEPDLVSAKKVIDEKWK